MWSEQRAQDGDTLGTLSCLEMEMRKAHRMEEESQEWQEGGGSGRRMDGLVPH